MNKLAFRWGARATQSIVVLVALGIGLSGCYSRREIEKTGFVLAAGIDAGANGRLKVIAEVAVPSAISGGPESGAGGGEKPTVIMTAEGDTVFDAIRELSKVSPLRLFWGQADVVVISSALARHGLIQVVDSLSREREFRPGARVYITNVDLDKLFSVESPLIAGNAEYILALTSLQSMHSEAPVTTSQELVMWYHKPRRAVLLPLLRPDPGVVSGADEKQPEAIRLEGSVAITDARYAGELTGIETRGVLWVIDQVHSGQVSVKSPLEPEAIISVRLLRSSSDVNVILDRNRIEDSTVEVCIKGEADIAEFEGTKQYGKEEEVILIDSALSGVIKEEVEKALAKAKEIKADVFGFGEMFREVLPAKTWSSVEDRWREIFPQLNVDVKVEFDIRRRGMTRYPPR